MIKIIQDTTLDYVNSSWYEIIDIGQGMVKIKLIFPINCELNCSCTTIKNDFINTNEDKWIIELNKNFYYVSYCIENDKSSVIKTGSVVFDKAQFVFILSPCNKIDNERIESGLREKIRDYILTSLGI